MKKLIACVLMVCLLGMGSLAYAETTTEDGLTNVTKSWQEKRETLQQKVQAAKDLASQVQPQIDEIRNNRTEIIGLRADAHNAYDAAAAHVKELKENPDSLTEEQIAELKDALETFRGYCLEFFETVGNIHTEVLEIRAARREQNIEQIKESLNNIIIIQEERIALLKSSIEEMESILEI